MRSCQNRTHILSSDRNRASRESNGLGPAWLGCPCCFLTSQADVGCEALREVSEDACHGIDSSMIASVYSAPTKRRPINTTTLVSGHIDRTIPNPAQGSHQPNTQLQFKAMLTAAKRINGQLIACSFCMELTVHCDSSRRAIEMRVFSQSRASVREYWRILDGFSSINFGHQLQPIVKIWWAP